MNQNWREENFELVISYGEWKDKQGKITLKENLLQTGKDFLESLQHFKMVHTDLKKLLERSSQGLEMQHTWSHNPVDKLDVVLFFLFQSFFPSKKIMGFGWRGFNEAHLGHIIKGTHYHYNYLMKSFYSSFHLLFIYSSFAYFLLLQVKNVFHKIVWWLIYVLHKTMQWPTCLVQTLHWPTCLVQTLHWPCMSPCKHIMTFKTEYNQYIDT